ncbi:MAG: universal stress protein [Thermoplasmatales archaeon]|nr:universal stress protein [Thermoplasmatales archaeon]
MKYKIQAVALLGEKYSSMNKILVGIDGSEGSQLALEKAMMLVSEGGEIILIAVVPTVKEKTFVEIGVYKKIKIKADQLIKNTIKEIGRGKFNIRGIVEEGDAAVKIIDIAVTLNVDLITLGSRGSSKIGVYPIGSIANKVVQYAHKPVMVVR